MSATLPTSAARQTIRRIDDVIPLQVQIISDCDQTLKGSDQLFLISGAKTTGGGAGCLNPVVRSATYRQRCDPTSVDGVCNVCAEDHARNCK